MNFLIFNFLVSKKNGHVSS